MTYREEPTPQAPPGYRSATSKRSYLIAMCLLMFAVLGARGIVLPMLGFAIAPAEEKDAPQYLPLAMVDTAVAWKGSLWCVAAPPQSNSLFFSKPEQLPWTLVRATENGWEESCTLPAGYSWLVPQGEKLWILTSDGVAEFDGETATNLPGKVFSDPTSKAFVLAGHPAVIAEADDEWAVYVWENRAWRKETTLNLPPKREAAGGSETIWAQMVNEVPYVFVWREGALYSHKGFPGEDARFPADWQQVLSLEEGELDNATWNIAAINGRPVVFHGERTSNTLTSTINAFARKGGGWRQVATITIDGPLMNLGAFTHPHGATLLAQVYPWTFHLLQIENDRVIGTQQMGRYVPVSGTKCLLAVVGIVLAVVITIMAAFVLTSLARRHRTHIHSHAEYRVEYASPARRVLARAVDAAIALGPGLVLTCVLAALPSPSFSTFAVFGTLIMVSGGWFLLILVLFSFFEGRRGKTPGKWLLGIRVLTLDLRPCGFGRGLQRNVLMIADAGVMQGMLGVILMAMTVRRQRLGDMVAQTIVIREGAHHKEET